MKAAEHTGDVTQRTTLDAAFTHRAEWLAFEVHYDEVVTSAEQLAQVEITMDANTGSADGAIANYLEVLHDLRFPTNQILHLWMQIGRHARQVLCKPIDGSAREATEALVKLPLIVRRKGFKY